MMSASIVIRYEMVQYLLSLISPDGELNETVTGNILPGMERLNDLGFFSQDTYFKFMDELIHGLIQRNCLNTCNL
jgi:hypothetical protein